MSLTTEFRQATQNGTCVCDFDVACPVHPSTDCGACEYACHCTEHGRATADCDTDCFREWLRSPETKRQTVVSAFRALVNVR